MERATKELLLLLIELISATIAVSIHILGKLFNI